jgi:hypothetical protein
VGPTRQRRQAARGAPREPSGEIPLEHRAYTDVPFGPFQSQGAPSSGDVDRKSSDAIDMRGVADWKTVFSVETGDFSWGMLLLTCEALASPTVAGSTVVEAWPWVEIRIVLTVNAQSYTYLEAGIGSHSSATIGDDTDSAGPVVLNFAPGEVPDKIEVVARARRGGSAETAGDVDEKLNLTAVSRFHK